MPNGMICLPCPRDLPRCDPQLCTTPVRTDRALGAAQPQAKRPARWRGVRIRTDFRSKSFDDARDTLPATDAHGDQAILLTGAHEFVDALDRQDRAGGTERMAQRNRTDLYKLLQRHELRPERFKTGD